MRFSILAAATALVSSVFAADHTVVVGNGTNTFEPNNVKAAVGDTVTFKFWPKNHSVAQATFAKPCEPMNNGFWSGYIPSTAKAASETFMYTVTNASAPIWFYCTQASHCQSGMVGVINGPTSGNTIEKFATAAKNATKNVTPTSTAGSGGKLATNGSSSATTPSDTS
ncbi:Cupredoxin, partial [Massarina eburnea CBS 473.64]